MSLARTSTEPDQDQSDPPVVAAEPARYGNLIERALEFVRAKGGAVHEDLLTVHVFGNRGHVKMWRPLLRGSLEQCDDLSLRADGYWVLRDLEHLPREGASPLLREFVAIDVETTGARPATHRVIEVAAVRFRDGEPVDRFVSFVSPSRRLSKMIVELTGIRDEDLVGAPEFSAIADELVAFIGASVVAGHNVSFDLGFLDAELRRAGRQVLANDRIDTVGLAVKLMPGFRKPNLQRVAAQLGLKGRDKHRADIDAELCGQVAIRLIERAQGLGVSDIDIVKAIANSAVLRPKDRLGSSRAALDRALLADVPRRPGVYLMIDRYDHIIYVGKAKNLRERVSSYFAQPVGQTRKMEGLVENLARIETVIVGSELEALLLESQLIRRYQPRYNTALRASERYPYIRIDLANPWPRMTVVRDRKGDGARYFGPYRNTSGARRTVEFLNDVLPLRTCPRTFRDAKSYGSPCIQLDLHKCLGPCTGKVPPADYRSLANDVVTFLEGDDAVLFDRLQQGLVAAAERLDFERAARIRNSIASAQQIVDVQRQMNDATIHHTMLVVQPSAASDQAVEIIMVAEGRRWAQITASAGEPDDAAGRLRQAWERYRQHGVPPLDNSAVDETAILNRWIHQRVGHAALLPIGQTMDDGVPNEIDWREVARRALALDRDALSAAPLALIAQETAEDGQEAGAVDGTNG